MGLFGASFSFDDVFSFDVSAEFGMVNGTIGEYVFDKNCKNTDNMVSRLDWDILTVPYGEINISVDLFKYLYLGGSGRIAIPVYSGVMQDYDWLNSIPPGTLPLEMQNKWLKDDPTELTNYSKHTNKVVNYYNISGKIGGNIPISRKFTITPYVGYEYDFISMESFNGYTKYKWNNFQESPMPTGKCITYAQEINQFIVGVEVDFEELKKFPLYFDFHFVPGLGKLVALDIHYARKTNGSDGTAFLDILSPIFLFDGKISGYYRFDKYNRLGLSMFFNYMPLTRGMNGVGLVKDGKLPESFSGNTTGQGGASRFLFGISLIYKFKF